jgi:hypothetical protein
MMDSIDPVNQKAPPFQTACIEPDNELGFFTMDSSAVKSAVSFVFVTLGERS